MNLNTKDKLRINLGCGTHLIDGFINVDLINYLNCSGAHFVQQDLFIYIASLEDSSVSLCLVSHVLEHLSHQEIVRFLDLIEKKLSADGVLEVYTPHPSNPYFYSDPTHKTPIGLHYFSYLVEKSALLRSIPKYSTNRLSLFNSRVRLLYRVPSFLRDYKFISFPLRIIFKLFRVCFDTDKSILFVEINEYFLSNLIAPYEIYFEFKRC